MNLKFVKPVFLPIQFILELHSWRVFFSFFIHLEIFSFFKLTIHTKCCNFEDLFRWRFWYNLGNDFQIRNKCMLILNLFDVIDLNPEFENYKITRFDSTQFIKQKFIFFFKKILINFSFVLTVLTKFKSITIHKAIKHHKNWGNFSIHFANFISFGTIKFFFLLKLNKDLFCLNDWSKFYRFSIHSINLTKSN